MKNTRQLDTLTNFTSTGYGNNLNRQTLISPMKPNAQQVLFNSPTNTNTLNESIYAQNRPYWSTGLDKRSKVISTQDPDEATQYATNYMTMTTQPDKPQKAVYSIPGSGRATPVRSGANTPGYPNPDRIPIFKHAVEAYGFMPNTNVVTAPTQRIVGTPGRGYPSRKASYVSVPSNPSPARSPISAGRRLPGRVVNTVRTEGQPVVVGERTLEGYEVGRTQRPSYVTEVVQGQPRLVNQVIGQPSNVIVTENVLPYRERRPSVVQQRVGKEVVQTVERPMIVEKYVDKPFEMIIEKPVPNYLEVEVPYDVVVEKPVEKVITRDVVTDKIVEVPVEKHVEVPFERVVEVPVEKIIEQPVIYDEIVEIPVERVVEEIVETIVENPIYYDNVQEVDINDLNNYQADAVLPTQVRYVEQEVKRFITNLR
jgi:hypothetical protein